MKTYEVIIAGLPHTIQLSDADAKSRGLTETKQQPAPKNKQAVVRNKGGAATPSVD